MGAVRLLAASEIRRRWRSAVLLAVLVGIVGAIVLSTAAGARRSETALPRFTVASRSADVSYLTAFQYTPTPAQMSAVRRIPDVAAVGGVRFYAIEGKGLPQSDSIGAAVGNVEGTQIERPRVIEGRAANPNAINELVVDQPMAEKSHLRVGQRIEIESLTPAQFRLASGGNGQLPAPAGPRLQLHIVGIVRRPLDLGDDATQGGIFILTPAFDRAYFGRIGNFGMILDVRTRHGASDVPAVDAAMQRIFAKTGGATPQPHTDATQGAKDAIDVLTLALWILALVAAIAGMVTLAIVLSREIGRISTDQATLRSIGLTRFQRVMVNAPRALIIAGGGAVVAVVGAIAVSPLFPIGVAREADPNIGFHVDWTVVGPGIIGVAVIVLAIAFVAAYRNTGRSALGALPEERQRASTIVDSAARIAAPPTVTNGLRMALEPGRGRTAVPVRSAYFGAVFGVLGVTAVLVFAASLGQLVNAPARYGWTWDFRAAQTDFNPMAHDACGSDAFGVTRVAGVSDAAAICYDGIQLGRRPVVGWSFTPLRGTIAPTLISGRAPQSDGEVALGALTLSALHLHIGDTVEGHGPKGSFEYHVVGRTVFPVLDQPQPLADGALFTSAGLAHVFDSNTQAGRDIVGRFAKGSDPAAVERRIAALPDLDAPSGPTVPVEIARIHQINWLPTTIAVLLGSLGLLAVGHALVTAVRRRRRDLALLKTLGFTRRQVHATVAWQSTTLAIVGLVVGIPAGLIVGRVLWRVVTDGLGVEAGTVLPAVACLLVIAGALVVVNLVAFFPARTAGRTSPGVSLRSE